MSGLQSWVDHETEFPSGVLIWPFQKISQICLDLLLAFFNFFKKSVRICVRAPLPLPGVLGKQSCSSENGNCDKML